jgi:hypothetical protein
MPTAATRNSRNAGLYLRPTGSGAYTKVNKTHGLKLGLGTDFSDDSGHGQKFKTALPGQHDFKVDVELWYQIYADTLKNYSLNETILDFLLYPNISDTLNYWSGSCYIGQDEMDPSLGKTVSEKYTLVLSGGDPTWNYAT